MDSQCHKFFDTLYELLTSLSLTFPEEGPQLDRLRNVLRANEDVRSIKGIMRRFAPNGQEIEHRDERLFHKEACLLPGVDFRLLWQQDISDTSRAALWQYLQVLNLMGAAIVADGAPTGAGGCSTLPAFSDAAGADLPGGVKVPGMIESLAKDIVSDIDIDPAKLGGDPLTAVKNLMANGGLAKVVKRVGDKIKSKVDSGELDQNELIGEAQQMLGSLKNMPGGQGDAMAAMAKTMESMMKSPSAVSEMQGEGMVASMLSAMTGGGEEQLPDLEEIERQVQKAIRKEYRTNQDAHRERLRAKLKARSGEK
jgi:hypothetical protein